MTPPIIDQDGRSTIASAEAQAALAAGDTQRARDKHAEAAELLERDLDRAQGDEDKHLIRFLAATQYYKGGHYNKALDLARKVRATFLPEGVARHLPGFLRDAQDRASPDYETRVHERVQTLWTAKDYAGFIETLREHPYAFSPADLAFFRALCCEALGKYRPAVLFFADAARRAPHDPAVLSALAPLPLNLAGQGKLQEAWEYVQAQLELFPNPVSHAVASLLYYHQALQDEGAARTSLFDKQAQYFAQAREGYARLPALYQNHREIKAVMGPGYEAAAFARYYAGDGKAAREMCEAAIAFDPASPNGWTLLGVITSAGAEAAGAFNAEAAGAFKKAVELGDQTYFPYYCLAYDALKKGAFREALDWSRQALERGDRQDPVVKSLLYQWSAISLAHLGAPRPEIEAFFKRAIDVAPNDELAKQNYRHFQASELPEPPPLVVRIPFQPVRKAGLGERKLVAVAG
jgi:tetratricopeptide (TPR) repeat protein